jgi:hypothetical protein
MNGGRTQAIRTKPAGIAVGQPKRPQLSENRRWDWDLALLVAFADDPNQPIGFVDGSDFQRRGLADPQPAPQGNRVKRSVTKG